MPWRAILSTAAGPGQPDGYGVYSAWGSAWQWQRPGPQDEHRQTGVASRHLTELYFAAQAAPLSVMPSLEKIQLKTILFPDASGNRIIEKDSDLIC